MDEEGCTGANNIGASALLCASRTGHVAVVQFLLTFGASIDLAKPNGASSLYIASLNNHIEVVTLLIDGGASVDLAMDDGATSLHTAAAKNHIEVVTLLLDRGASVDLAMKNGCTPLHTASRKNNIEVATVLLDRGASLDSTTDNGQTPLYIASYNNSIEAMKQLLAAGASRDVAAKGWTALKAAKHFNHIAAMELLEAWPLLSQHLLMVATITRNSAAVRELLHSGEDPAFAVQYQQHTLSAVVLARNETSCSWAAPVCTDTLRLIERSLEWSAYDLEAHYLFSPAFRRGVRHVLGLMVALERAGRGLSQHMWMLIVASLPRCWGLTIN